MKRLALATLVCVGLAATAAPTPSPHALTPSPMDRACEVLTLDRVCGVSTLDRETRIMECYPMLWGLSKLAGRESMGEAKAYMGLSDLMLECEGRRAP